MSEPNPALRDRLAEIIKIAARQYPFGSDIDEGCRGIADAILASEEWQMREAVLNMAQETWDSVPGSYDHNDPMVRRHAAALNDLGVLLSRLMALRGTT